VGRSGLELANYKNSVVQPGRGRVQSSFMSFPEIKTDHEQQPSFQVSWSYAMARGALIYVFRDAKSRSA
jgi:hypothetical protein